MDDMTLAEFEKEAEAVILGAASEASGIPDIEIDVDDLLRPLILRLLAAERQRVADQIEHDYDGEYVAEMVACDIRNMEGPA